METSVSLRPHVGFEVEKIVGISSDGGYKVQWAPTWVSRYHLIGCEHLIQEFLQQQAEDEHRVPIASTEAIVHCDPELVSEQKDVKISHLTEMGSRSNNAELQANVPVTQNIGAADTVNLHDEVHRVLEEVKVKVTESIEAMEPNYTEPVANVSKNGDIGENINQEMRTDQMGKMDEIVVGGHSLPCVVENADEINQLEIDAKFGLLSHLLDAEFQDFSAEYQERKPDPFVARRDDHCEMNQEEQNSSCDEGEDELGNVSHSQHSEILSSNNGTDLSCSTMCSGNSNATQSDVSLNVIESCQPFKMNTFVLNIERLNVQSQKISREEPSDSADYARRNRKYACTTCGKKFYRKKYLRKHQEIHNADYRYICEKCDASFPRNYHLIRHLQTTHSSFKPYSCNIRSCKMRFTRKDNCQRHIRQHKDRIRIRRAALSQCTENATISSNPCVSESSASQKRRKIHICPICGEQFTLKSFLIQHFRRHSEYKPHLCQHCNSSFHDSASLKAHQYVHSISGERK